MEELLLLHHHGQHDFCCLQSMVQELTLDLGPGTCWTYLCTECRSCGVRAFLDVAYPLVTLLQQVLDLIIIISDLILIFVAQVIATATRWCASPGAVRGRSDAEVLHDVYSGVLSLSEWIMGTPNLLGSHPDM